MILFAACSSIDVALTKGSLPEFDRIAVLPFTVKNASWGDEFTDSVQAQLMKQTGTTVVERAQLKKILKEQQMSQSGLVDDSSAVNIGRLLNVKYIIVGTGTALKGRSDQNLIDTFSLKILDVETGAVVMNIRKEPGTEWTPWLRTKYTMGFFYFWTRKEIFLESSTYDHIAKQMVLRIAENLKK